MAKRTTSIKREKFKELAEARTNKALDSLRLIGNLSNKSIYEYEPKQVQKIVSAIKKAVADMEDRFRSPYKKRDRFKL